MTPADVMGRGVPAALLSASVRAVRGCTFRYDEPCEVITRAAALEDPRPRPRTVS